MKSAPTRRFRPGDRVYITNGGIRERAGTIVSRGEVPKGLLLGTEECLVELDGAPGFLLIADINPVEEHNCRSIERVDSREAGYPYPPSVHFPKKPASDPNGGP